MGPVGRLIRTLWLHCFIPLKLLGPQPFLIIIHHPNLNRIQLTAFVKQVEAVQAASTVKGAVVQTAAGAEMRERQQPETSGWEGEANWVKYTTSIFAGNERPANARQRLRVRAACEAHDLTATALSRDRHEVPRDPHPAVTSATFPLNSPALAARATQPTGSSLLTSCDFMRLFRAEVPKLFCLMDNKNRGLLVQPIRIRISAEVKRSAACEPPNITWVLEISILKTKAYKNRHFTKSPQNRHYWTCIVGGNVNMSSSGQKRDRF